MSELPPQLPDINKPQVQEPVATPAMVAQPIRPWTRFKHFIQQIRKQGLWLTLVEGGEQITRLTTGAPTLRFSRLLPDLHLGGQYLECGWPILQRRGVTGVINMRAESGENPARLPPAQYLHLPTVDNHAPTLEQLRSGVAFIRQHAATGGRVYVHCWEGVGRAPTLSAAYLVSTGLTPDEAWHELRQVRPFVRPSQPQLEQILRFAEVWKNPEAAVVPEPRQSV